MREGAQPTINENNQNSFNLNIYSNKIKDREGTKTKTPKHKQFEHL